jgi:hypothetical protein
LFLRGDLSDQHHQTLIGLQRRLAETRDDAAEIVTAVSGLCRNGAGEKTLT